MSDSLSVNAATLFTPDLESPVHVNFVFPGERNTFCTMKVCWLGNSVLLHANLSLAKLSEFLVYLDKCKDPRFDECIHLSPNVSVMTSGGERPNVRYFDFAQHLGENYVKQIVCTVDVDNKLFAGLQKVSEEKLASIADVFTGSFSGPVC